jgi:hypothetical protein
LQPGHVSPASTCCRRWPKPNAYALRLPSRHRGDASLQLWTSLRHTACGRARGWRGADRQYHCSGSRCPRRECARRNHAHVKIIPQSSAAWNPAAPYRPTSESTDHLEISAGRNPMRQWLWWHSNTPRLVADGWPYRAPTRSPENPFPLRHREGWDCRRAAISHGNGLHPASHRWSNPAAQYQARRPDSYQDLQDHLAIFLRKAKRRADKSDDEEPKNYLD